jgi:hypothetical protein
MVNPLFWVIFNVNFLARRSKRAQLQPRRPVGYRNVNMRQTLLAKTPTKAIGENINKSSSAAKASPPAIGM